MTISIRGLACTLTLAGGIAAIGPVAAFANLCDAAAERAARDTAVPLAVLRAISHVETGRKRGGAFEAWPWTVNVEGKGHWFDSRDAALSFAYKTFNSGARSFDIGCFQINFRWHGEAFSSIDDMFDPVKNARYAAEFLTRLYRESGDWSVAAGAYHSRTQKHADRYRAAFDRHLKGLPNDPVVPRATFVAETVTARRSNGFPLLNGGVSRGLGSLVPVSGGLTPLFPMN